jgi:hypothetical protein
MPLRAVGGGREGGHARQGRCQGLQAHKQEGGSAGRAHSHSRRQASLPSTRHAPHPHTHTRTQGAPVQRPGAALPQHLLHHRQRGGAAGRLHLQPPADRLQRVCHGLAGEGGQHAKGQAGHHARLAAVVQPPVRALEQVVQPAKAGGWEGRLAGGCGRSGGPQRGPRAGQPGAGGEAAAEPLRHAPLIGTHAEAAAGASARRPGPMRPARLQALRMRPLAQAPPRAAHPYVMAASGKMAAREGPSPRYSARQPSLARMVRSSTCGLLRAAHASTVMRLRSTSRG